MELREIETIVKEIFEQQFPEIAGKEFDFGKKQDQFENWDSFSHMWLISKIEEKFKVSLEINEVVELDSPQRFVQIVDKKLNGR